MNPFGGMKEKGRCPGTGQRRRDLLSDQARLTHAGDHDLALATKQQVNGFRELSVQPLDQRLHGTRFYPQHTPAFGHAVAVGALRGRGRALRAQFLGLAASHMRMTRSRRDFS